MNYVNIIKLSVVFIVFVILACTLQKAPATAPSRPGPSLVKEGEQLTAKEAWEKEWEKTLVAARKESAAIVYVSVIAPAVREGAATFKRRFGIDLDIITGRGAEIRSRLLQERANGLFIADVFISGQNSMLGDIKPAGATDLLEPALMLPEVINPNLWHEGRLPWSDEEKTVFKFLYYPTPMMTVNTNMVKPGEVKSHRDLLDPRWKGKIVINDPTISGMGFTSFSALVFHKILDLDFFRQLIKQEPVVIRDQRLQVEWVARGRFPLALWAETGQISELQKAGASIEIVVPSEETYIRVGGGALALIKRAPHPNTARIFINWFLGKEGQNIVQNTLGEQSARTDISTEAIHPLLVRKPGVKYHTGPNEDLQWIRDEQKKYFDLAKEAFGPVLK